MSIDELVQAISDWASAALPDTEVKLRSPTDLSAASGVAICIIGFRGLRGRGHAMARRDPVIDHVEVDLLVCVAESDPLALASKVAELQFAALEGGPFTVAASEDTRSILTELERPPGSGLLLRGEIARQRAAKPIPLVREASFDLTDKNSEPAEPNSTPSRSGARGGRRRSQA